jgi:hypothetical protein
MRNSKLKAERSLNLAENVKWFALAASALACGTALVITNACTATPTLEPANNASTTSSSPLPGPSRAPGANPKSVPTSLANAGEYGENIYDFAKANDWTKAAGKLASLKQAVQQIHNDLKESNADVDKLDSNIAVLDKDVTAKDRPATMRAANQTTCIVADLTAPLNPPLPIEVTRLDCEGRELEIWAGAKDMAKLKMTAAEMQQAWETLRPQVESHGGTAVAKKFGDLVARVEAARTTDEYARLATPILDEVDNLEKVFQKKP